MVDSKENYKFDLRVKGLRVTKHGGKQFFCKIFFVSIFKFRLLCLKIKTAFCCFFVNGLFIFSSFPNFSVQHNF